MAQAAKPIGPLPTMPLEAAELFHAEIVPGLLRELGAMPDGSDMVAVFHPADPRHNGWRLAAVQDVARAAAPVWRFNAVVGTDGAAIGTVLAWLASAPGITGQVFHTDGATGQEALD